MQAPVTESQTLPGSPGTPPRLAQSAMGPCAQRPKLGNAQHGTGPGTDVLVDVLVVLVVLVVGGIVVLEYSSTGHAPGAGAFFLLSMVPSFLAWSPPNIAQYRFESVPTVSTMPTSSENGVSRVTPVPLQTAFTMVAFTSTTLQGSPGEPAPVYL